MSIQHKAICATRRQSTQSLTKKCSTESLKNAHSLLVQQCSWLLDLEMAAQVWMLISAGKQWFRIQLCVKGHLPEQPCTCCNSDSSFSVNSSRVKNVPKPCNSAQYSWYCSLQLIAKYNLRRHVSEETGTFLQLSDSVTWLSDLLIQLFNLSFLSVHFLSATSCKQGSM